MLDHATKWAVSPEWGAETIDASGVTVRSLFLPDLAIVSGDLSAFGRATGLDPQGAGALGLVQGDSYTLRLARDRLLVVGALPDTVRESWNDAGFAVTLIGGADHVFELCGEGVEMLLSHAVTINPDHAGPAATVGFAGVSAVLYRHDQIGTLRLHVERGLAVYIWSWLQGVLGAV